jgi:hypothetical protein
MINWIKAWMSKKIYAFNRTNEITFAMMIHLTAGLLAICAPLFILKVIALVPMSATCLYFFQIAQEEKHGI